jgi:hypothetical protein
VVVFLTASLDEHVSAVAGNVSAVNTIKVQGPYAYGYTRDGVGALRFTYDDGDACSCQAVRDLQFIASGSACLQPTRFLR